MSHSARKVKSSEEGEYIAVSYPILQRTERWAHHLVETLCLQPRETSAHERWPILITRPADSTGSAIVLEFSNELYSHVYAAIDDWKITIFSDEVFTIAADRLLRAAHVSWA